MHFRPPVDLATCCHTSAVQHSPVIQHTPVIQRTPDNATDACRTPCTTACHDATHLRVQHHTGAGPGRLAGASARPRGAQRLRLPAQCARTAPLRLFVPLVPDYAYPLFPIMRTPYSRLCVPLIPAVACMPHVAAARPHAVFVPNTPLHVARNAAAHRPDPTRAPGPRLTRSHGAKASRAADAADPASDPLRLRRQQSPSVARRDTCPRGMRLCA